MPGRGDGRDFSVGEWDGTVESSNPRFSDAAAIELY